MALTMPHPDYSYLESLLRSPVERAPVPDGLLRPTDGLLRPLPLPFGYWPVLSRPTPYPRMDDSLSKSKSLLDTKALLQAHVNSLVDRHMQSLADKLESSESMRSDHHDRCEVTDVARRSPSSDTDGETSSTTSSDTLETDKHIPPKLRHKLRQRKMEESSRVSPHPVGVLPSDEPRSDAPGPLRRPASLVSLQAVKALINRRATPDTKRRSPYARPQERPDSSELPYPRLEPHTTASFSLTSQLNSELHSQFAPMSGLNCSDRQSPLSTSSSSPSRQVGSPVNTHDTSILDGMLRGRCYSAWASASIAPVASSPTTTRPSSAHECPLDLSPPLEDEISVKSEAAKQRTRDVLRQFRSIMTPVKCSQTASESQDRSSVLRAILEGEDREMKVSSKQDTKQSFLNKYSLSQSPPSFWMKSDSDL